MLHLWWEELQVDGPVVWSSRIGLFTQNIYYHDIPVMEAWHPSPQEMSWKKTSWHFMPDTHPQSRAAHSRYVQDCWVPRINHPSPLIQCVCNDVIETETWWRHDNPSKTLFCILIPLLAFGYSGRVFAMLCSTWGACNTKNSKDEIGWAQSGEFKHGKIKWLAHKHLRSL